MTTPTSNTTTPTSNKPTNRQDNEWLLALGHTTLEPLDDLANAAVVRFPNTPTLFVRPCFRVLYLLVTTFLAHTLEPYVVLTGSHGVGKRRFLQYVVCRLRTTQPTPPTIVLDVPNCFACITSDGTIRDGDRDSSFREALADRRVFYLCGATDHHTPLRGPTIRAKTLVVAPPGHAREDGLSKSITLVLPPWSPQELESCRAACYPHVTPEELSTRQAMWGGLVRWTLAEPLATAQSQFARSLDGLTLASAVELIKMRGRNDTFQQRDATLCSRRVASVLVATAPNSDHVVRFLQTHRADFSLHRLLDQIEHELVRHLVAL